MAALQKKAAFMFYYMFACCYVVSLIGEGNRVAAAVDDEEHIVPSALVHPLSTRGVYKRGRRFPIRCVMDDGVLYAVLGEPSSAASRLVFEWSTTWAAQIDPRDKSDGAVQNRKYSYTVPLHSIDTPASIALPTTPKKTRVLVRVETTGESSFWDTTVKSCWTGRRVSRPGQIEMFDTISLSKISTSITLPTVANGPLDGLMLRWCPISEPNCAPEDVLFSEQMGNVADTFSILLEPTEDHEDEDHELCGAAYNLHLGERLLGPMRCTRVKKALLTT